MIETLVAIAILGTAVLAAVTSISTSTKVTGEASEKATAVWVAASQIDLVRASPFVLTPGTYPNVTAPPRYSVTNATSPYPGGDANIQLVTITVRKDGVVASSTSLIKVNR
jgi:type II secretory pathway pseudopilin PulG